MSDEIRIAVIASASALLGGVIGVFGSVVTERIRSEAGRKERIDERRVELLVGFGTSVVEWITYMTALPPRQDPAHAAMFEKLVTNAEKVRAAAEKLELLGPDEISEWVRTTYHPLQHALYRAVQRAVVGEGSNEEVERAAKDLRQALNAARGMFRAAVADLR
ncbi:MAG: hypothetical protein M3273_05995 [Actinomycetota bacterium]|nr:hypothetical protein [Actinomycetota bacterium]